MRQFFVVKLQNFSQNDVIIPRKLNICFKNSIFCSPERHHNNFGNFDVFLSDNIKLFMLVSHNTIGIAVYVLFSDI